MMNKVGCRGTEKPHSFQTERVRHPKAVVIVGFLLLVLAGSAGAQQATTYRVAGIVVNDGDGGALGRGDLADDVSRHAAGFDHQLS